MITGRSLFIGGLVSLMATLGACQNDGGSSSDAKDSGIYNGGGASTGVSNFANATASIDLNNLPPVKEDINMNQVSHAKIHTDQNGVDLAIIIIEDIGPDGQSRRRVYKGEKATQMGGGGGGKVGGQVGGDQFGGQQQAGFGGQQAGFGGQQAGFGGGGGW